MNKLRFIFVVSVFLSLTQCESTPFQQRQIPAVAEIRFESTQLVTYSPALFSVLTKKNTRLPKNITAIQPENGEIFKRENGFLIYAFDTGRIRIKLLNKRNNLVLTDTVVRFQHNPLITEEWYDLKPGQLPEKGITKKEFEVFQYFMIQRNRNRPFPDFQLQTAKNDTLTQEAFKGQVSIVFTWFYNCPHCKLPIPYLNAAREKYAVNPKVKFYSFFRDDLQVTENGELRYESVNRGEKRFVPLDTALHLITCKNAKSFLEQLLYHQAYPTAMLIDHEGVIRRIIAGSKCHRITEEIDKYL